MGVSKLCGTHQHVIIFKFNENIKYHVCTVVPTTEANFYYNIETNICKRIWLKTIKTSAQVRRGCENVSQLKIPADMVRAHLGQCVMQRTL